MADGRTIEECYLYQLAQAEGLGWFKHMVLVSSYQDQYAPFDSARIQICCEAAQDVNRGSGYI